jgi:predicted kinase
LLVVFGGLPGTGKTTIARALAARHSAVYLRIDEIEQAIRLGSALGEDVGPVGYVVAGALAVSNLRNGLMVVADCVNPIGESRAGWRATAAEAQSPLLEIELVCSNTAEHRRRVETRRPDIEGHALPTWQAVVDRDYTPWPEPHLVIDTAHLSPLEAVELVERHLKRSWRAEG